MNTIRSNRVQGLKNYAVWLLALWIGALGCNEQQPQSAQNLDAEKLFAFQVYPLLESRCFSCHGGGEELEGEFDMRTLKGMLAGGESGKPALIPGLPAKSRIYMAAIRDNDDFKMPPKENDKLDKEELNLLRQWIQGGAPWPDQTLRMELLAAGGWDYKGKIQVSTDSAQTESWGRRTYYPAEIWAFFPVKKQPIPWEALNYDSTANPIDAFVQSRLIEYGLVPAPPAEKVDLLRRGTFDLIGLPPTKAEIEDFELDSSPDAFEEVVDRLLASLHYGEQWARHWLDVVRYADSDGFSNDYSRPNAWRYRDYVVRSFNEDKPYDRFVVEQIAGDELNGDDPEMLIATGYLRMGPWEHTGMSVAAETRQFFLDDVTNNVGEVFLSQPLRCARCHDHKYDPIPTVDYYKVQAVFATTQFANRTASYLPAENVARLDLEKEKIVGFIKETERAQALIEAKEQENAKRWYANRGMNYLPINQRRKLHDDQQPPRYYGLTHQDLGYRKLLSKRGQRLAREKEVFEQLAFSVYNGPVRVMNSHRPMPMPPNLEGDIASTFVLKGGSVYAPDEEVAPGILSALASLQDSAGRSLDARFGSGPAGRRLKFARWVIHPDNPLTARSIVNRVWQYHFGKGIAENTNNFGVTGKRPTHPEMLDWMAGYFVENGWSMKELHRLIMSSEAYQRSTQHPQMEQLLVNDPENKYLAMFTPRRLEAEEIRDAMLQLSGELNPEIGGLPVRPEINLEQALQPRHIMGSVAPAYQPSATPRERNRRTIYAQRLRGLSDPLMEVFNRPGSELSCEKRTSSAVTPQVFMLFNSSQVRDRSIALANEICLETTALDQRVRQVYERVFNRAPTKDEVREATQFLASMKEYHRETPAPRIEYPDRVEREMFEEMTGENFRYIERLHVYQNYQADLKSWEVDEETRALADYLVILFNTNEFIYVY